MKASEIVDMSREERDRKLGDLTQELFNLRFQHASGQLENNRRIKQVRKDIARIHTVNRELALNIRTAGDNA